MKRKAQMEFEITTSEKEDAEKIHKILDRLFEALKVIPSSKNLVEMKANLIIALEVIDEALEIENKYKGDINGKD
jgi:4-aminobutyrate aminotransferase-like enzyme